MRVSKHFPLREFRCNDRARTLPPKRYHKNVKRLARNLEVLRYELGGKPLKLNSAYRTRAYNRKVGGGKRSQHLTARACDIRCTNPRKVYLLVLRLIKEGKMDQGGVGWYQSKGFIHYDIRPGRPARWKG